MEKYSFFNAVVNDDGVYDRVYKAEDIAAYFSSFIGNGVYPNPSTNLQIISANDGMKIKAKVGKAWINGYYYENTEEIVFKLDNADAQYDRIDAVVLRLDFLERTITLQIKKGTTAIKPIAPALQRDADAYELKIAEIYVSKGVVDITDIVITDTRQLSDVCGLVSGVVEQINVDDLFLQYNSAFDTWFEHIKDQLTEDAAGNLQAQIDNLNNKIQLPIGYIFDWCPVEGDNTDLSSPEKVAEHFGYGTWKELNGVFTFARKEGYEVGSTGGEETHKLTVEEMPSHKHKPSDNGNFASNGGGTSAGFGSGPYWFIASSTNSVGGDQPHNNMPPYLVVYKWQRIA